MDQDYLIKKWLNNDLSEAEMEAFKLLDDHELYLDIIDAAQAFKASNDEVMPDFNTFKQRYQKLNKPVKKLHWMNPLLKIAAILVIVLGVYFTFFNSAKITVETLANQKTSVELPDASSVMLNALSSIKYQKRNWDNNRTLQLNGEAYFKVAKGSTFDVLTEEGLVSVVGTEFNVKQRDNYFEVICFEGSVEVSLKVDTRDFETILIKGESVLFLNSNLTERTISTLEPDWISNRSIFSGIPLYEVFDELMRQFAIDISFNDVNLERLFTGGFSHDSLENALTAIVQPMNLTYELTPSKQVIIHGKKN